MFCEMCGAPENAKKQMKCRACGNEFAARSASYIFSPIITVPLWITVFWAAVFNWADIDVAPEILTVLMVGGVIYGISFAVKRWKKSRI